MVLAEHGKDQLGIADHRIIRVVGNENHLPSFLDRAQRGHNAGKDECIVEIILGLVDYQRHVRFG